MLNEYGEGQIVAHLFGWRIRIYLGHTSNPGRRIRHWHSGISEGIYICPWSNRVAGIQWRRT